MSPVRVRLAVTLGDCAGIGPELVLRALASPELVQTVQLIAYGNAVLFNRVASAAGIRFPVFRTVRQSDLADALSETSSHILVDDPFSEANDLAPGRVHAVCGAKAAAWIRQAVADIRNGLGDALVTAPVNKEALHLAGVGFSGHTELLAHLTRATDPCMAFYADGLFVSLATIHEAISNVPRLLTLPGLSRTIRLTHTACVDFGIEAPRIGVLALNPHAGEHGLFGCEEASVIQPVIETLRAEGLDVSGPLVPDTAFTWLFAGKKAPYDAYVAMYHDQGLIPFKMVAFDSGVNVTLGLPIIRTSPDHGTAFDIAWQGKAAPDSLFSAIRLAARMVAQTRARKA